jgi:carbonic anhydrase
MQFQCDIPAHFVHKRIENRHQRHQIIGLLFADNPENSDVADTSQIFIQGTSGRKPFGRQFDFADILFIADTGSTAIIKLPLCFFNI